MIPDQLNGGKEKLSNRSKATLNPSFQNQTPALHTWAWIKPAQFGMHNPLIGIGCIVGTKP